MKNKCSNVTAEQKRQPLWCW